MNLILPDVSGPATAGPEWAAELNAALQRLDLHDHSSGQGLKITPAGLNINADLTLNNNNLVAANKVGMKNQSAALSGVSNANSISIVNGNLYITNSGGTPVQITNGNSIVSSVVVAGNPLMPSGTVLDFAGSVIPIGFLACDGTDVSRTLYPDLFTSIGTSFGTGNGTTTFTLPNFNGKVSVGSGTYADAGTGTSLTRSLAQGQSTPLGESVHQLTLAEMPSHNHGGGDHTHPIYGIANQGTNVGNADNVKSNQQLLNNTGPSGVIIATQGGDLKHNNMQPSLVINKMIKT